jgi:hypothetical protein
MKELMKKQQRNQRPYLFILSSLFVLFVFLAEQRYPAQAEPITVSPLRGTSTHPIYGVNFITSAEDPADAQQFQNGQATGAAWNRWPMYWFNIEQSEGNFIWAAVDTAVQGDITYGFQTDAILLGTPPFYTTSLRHIAGDPPPTVSTSRPSLLSLDAIQTATPVGLYDPVFTDGSDIPGPGKSINPNNRWARFVSTAVNRYKPGGVLAQQAGWPAGAGITHWEIWNEEDYLFFWDGTVADYARLLKVAYLTIEQTDPTAQIIFGGLSNINLSTVANPNFYNDIMALFDADPLAATFNYFHDILATHSYFYAWNSWYHVWRAHHTLAIRGLDKPIWLNENGVPAWDDYPGPVWDPHSGFRATMTEQADFVIQSALFSTFAGADGIFHFQLYDGCGNQPAGTDFPPHNGELCDEDGQIPGTNFPCAGDANGLFRNPTDATCFTQHPNPESPRPHFDAYRVLTDYFTDVEPLWRLRPGGSDPANGPQEWIAFYQPTTESRVLGMWARFGQAETAVVPTTNQSGNGLLITPDGITQTVVAQNGVFTLTLPAATNQNAPWDPTLYAIGGRPYLLIEQDTLAPVLSLTAPPFAEYTIHLSWNGADDGSGVANYDLFVAVDGSPAEPWLAQTTQTTAVYQSQPFHAYTFTLRGRDRAGNVGGDTAVTVPTLALPEKTYLPHISR